MTEPWPDIPTIRAHATERATATGKYGLRNDLAETILALCDYIDNRASAYRPPFDWYDQHRELVLHQWGAIPATVRGFTNARLWIVPEPGATEITRLCPACGNQRDRRRHCDNCERTGMVRVTLEAT